MSTCSALRVLADVRERLGDDEVRRALDGRRRPSVEVDRDAHVQRRPARERRDRRLEPAVGEHRRVDAARQVAQLLERLARAAAGVGEQLARRLGVGGELLLGHAEAHAERDEARLRAVVQVALDAAQLGLLLVDGAGARRLERGDALGERAAAQRRASTIAAWTPNATSSTRIGQTGQK